MQWERKTGRSWGTRTRRCPCLERSFNVQRSNIPHWRLEFHPPNKLPSILLLGPVTSHLTRSTKEPIVDRFFGRKARQIYFFSVAITHDSKRKQLETLSSASVRAVTFPLDHAVIVNPISPRFQTTRMSCPEGKQTYISIRWPLVVSGQRGDSYSSSRHPALPDSMVTSGQSEESSSIITHSPNRTSFRCVVCCDGGWKTYPINGLSISSSGRHQVLTYDEDYEGLLHGFKGHSKIANRLGNVLENPNPNLPVERVSAMSTNTAKVRRL